MELQDQLVQQDILQGVVEELVVDQIEVNHIVQVQEELVVVEQVEQTLILHLVFLEQLILEEVVEDHLKDQDLL
jgi:hypothetical protein